MDNIALSFKELLVTYIELLETILMRWGPLAAVAAAAGPHVGGPRREKERIPFRDEDGNKHACKPYRLFFSK